MNVRIETERVDLPNDTLLQAKLESVLMSEVDSLRVQRVTTSLNFHGHLMKFSSVL
jgi:hypothetical protein